MLAHPAFLSSIRRSKDIKSTDNRRFLDTSVISNFNDDSLCFYNLLGTVDDDNQESYSVEKFNKYSPTGKTENDY
jgi:hypothetical protein